MEITSESVMLNQRRPAAFTHELLDLNYPRHMRDSDDKWSGYQRKTDAYHLVRYMYKMSRLIKKPNNLHMQKQRHRSALRS